MNSRWCVGKGEGEGGGRRWEEGCAFSAALAFLKRKCRWTEGGIPKSDFYEMLDWKCCFIEATGHSRNVLDFVGEDFHRWNCAHPQVSVAEPSLVTVVFTCVLGFFYPHYP